MKARMMTPRLLAQNMGVCAWRVRWHLRPQRFAKLSDAWIARYAACLDMTAQHLQACKRSGDV
jgi:hypothetical protein